MGANMCFCGDGKGEGMKPMVSDQHSSIVLVSHFTGLVELGSGYMWVGIHLCGGGKGIEKTW